ncbi:hypothetical protein M3765_11770 [Streptomyces thermoviolaceus]|uniref:hypothetical protein n=1 Tax=Streptomyces thermoviolaceus TaxID=1952 RepID=UPI00203AC202|nr:hypothetical protein [Streptomyces thermoviolaceus]MCM3264698.1 hypothetical protein [Streptomyces thermoviolaceus]
MTTYALTFEVQPPCDVASVETAFYEHFDGTVAESFGRFLVTVYVDGHDNGVNAAQHAAMELQRKLDVVVCRLDRDLVDASEIARRTDRSRENIRQIIHGERHKREAFPAPLGAPNGKSIWEWGVVNECLRRNIPDVSDPETYLSRDEMAIVDAWLVRWGTMPRDQHVRSEFYEITAAHMADTDFRDRRGSHRPSVDWVSSWNVRRQTRNQALTSRTAG